MTEQEFELIRQRVLSHVATILDELRPELGLEPAVDIDEVNIKAFIDEDCEIGNFETKSKTLYSEYKRWATENNITPPSHVSFSRTLNHVRFYGIKHEKKRDGGYFIGVKPTERG